jgi:uncharacterized repeat protein (TIGR04076 family)
MARCKITVIKRSLNKELADKYISDPVVPCENYTDGQEFIVSEGLEKPHGFCSWAWNDIYKTVVAISRGGNFNQGLFADWMKDDKSLITCCTDGIRPVIFLVERLEN